MDLLVLIETTEEEEKSQQPGNVTNLNCGAFIYLLSIPL